VTPREWNTAVGTGLLRIAAGTALLRWRKTLAVRLAGAAYDDRVVPLLFGYFGVRDITVGVLTLASTRPDGDVAKAVALQGHADSTDTLLVAGVMQTGHIPRSRGLVAIAVAGLSAAGEYATAWRLRRH
jgi:hypothetical protein